MKLLIKALSQLIVLSREGLLMKIFFLYYYLSEHSSRKGKRCKMVNSSIDHFIHHSIQIIFSCFNNKKSEKVINCCSARSENIPLSALSRRLINLNPLKTSDYSNNNKNNPKNFN